MSNVVTNQMNSAIISGQFGLNNASSEITTAAYNIAQSSSSAEPTSINELLADASVQNLELVKDVLPSAGDSLTSELISLQVNSLNAQASANVVDTANETVGTIINTLA